MFVIDRPTCHHRPINVFTIGIRMHAGNEREWLTVDETRGGGND
jgi:hypothetical protein